MTEADKIKITLFKNIAREMRGDYIAVPEVSLPGCVADMLVTNGDIHIYEIKSKSDSLVRLQKQMESYKKHAHRVTVVADGKFIGKLMEASYMSGVGIMEVTSRGAIKPIREAITSNVKNESYLEFWAPIEIRETMRGFPGWYKWDTDEAKEKLLSTLNDDELRRLTIFRIKEKYRSEFYLRLDAVQAKDNETALKSRFNKLETLHVTPLLNVPLYVFRDFF